MRNIVLIITLCLSVDLFAQTVKVAAAGDMKYIMPELLVKYKTISLKAIIEVTYGSSGTFFQQIVNGASFDVYFSADISYPQKLKEQGLVSGNVSTYAFGAVVLWSSVVDVSKGIDVLKNQSINKVAIANPQHAPYGKRAEECLKFYGLYESLSSKLIFGDNVLQTAQYALTGNADVAFIALSIALAPEIASKGKYYKLDPKSYKPVEQACVLLKGWERNPEAKKFMLFVLSDACKPIFQKYGFILP